MWLMTVENGITHWIELDGAVNARAVVPGVLLRSDNLQDLSERDITELVQEHGLEVVIDLRTGVEVELEGPGPLVAEPAVRIEHRSLYPETGGNTDLDADTVRPWGSHDEDALPDEIPVVRAYMSYLQRRPDSVVESIRAIANAEGAVLVHCAAGKDRTGVVVALALDAVGVDRALIVEDYLLTAERIDEILARLRSTETYRAELEGHDSQRHAPAPGTMERVLEIVDERLGGSVAWLEAHGFTRADLDRLRSRLSANVNAHGRARNDRGGAAEAP
jgi:protein-tyrosine phosphatase